MIKMRLLALAVVLGMLATPAMADLFHFSVHNLDLTYDGTTFTASRSASGLMGFTRDVTPVGTITFESGTPGSFGIEMAISDILGYTAWGAGTFRLADIDGDVVSGDVTGQWIMLGGAPTFLGLLAPVNYVSHDGYFNSTTGSVPMSFDALLPWSGSVVQLTASSARWFGSGAWLTKTGGLRVVQEAGSLDAHVVPLPAAVLLGMLGLGAAGLRLRRLA